MALKHPDQPLAKHETQTVTAVFKSRQLGCFRVRFKVFPGCFRVFPGVSEGFRTKSFMYENTNTNMNQYLKRFKIVVIQMQIEQLPLQNMQQTYKSMITDRVFPAWGATPLYITKRKKGPHVQR